MLEDFNMVLSREDGLIPVTKTGVESGKLYKRESRLKCDECHGIGMKVRWHPAGRLEALYPCPKCNGSGIAHCCEGGREQPEKDDGS